MREWILEEFHRYARFTLLAALLLAVVARSRATRDVFGLVKLSLLWVGAVVAFGIWIISAVERRRWLPRVRLAVPTAAFLLVVALSTAWSRNPRISLVGESGRYGGLIPTLLYGSTGLLVVALYWERPLDLRGLAKVLAGAAFAEAILVCLQKTGLEGLRWTDPFTGGRPVYPIGTMGNSDFAGASLAILLPLTLYLAVTARARWAQAVYGAELGTGLAALWFTQTRGGMLAAAAGFGVVALPHLRRADRWVRGGVAFVAATAVVAGGLVFLHPRLSGARAALARLEPFRTSSVVDRGRYWASALRIARDHPVVGTGPDTFFETYPRYRSPVEGAARGLALPDAPHNIFLGYAANSGVLSLGTYLILVALAFRYAVRRFPGLQGEERWLLLALTGMLAAYLTQGFFSIDVPALAVLGWVAVGAIAVVADPGAVAGREQPARPAPSVPRWLAGWGSGGRAGRGRPAGASRSSAARWLHLAGTVAGVGAALAVGLRPFVADRRAEVTGRVGADGRRPTAQARHAGYLHAARLMPLDPTYAALAGAAAMDAAEGSRSDDDRVRWFGRAAGGFSKALEVQPANVVLLANLANVYGNWGVLEPTRFRVADRLWRRAILLDPTDWELHMAYAGMLGLQATTDPGDDVARRRQIEQLAWVTAVRPHDADTWAELALAYYRAGDPAKGQEALQTALRIDPKNKAALRLAAATPSSIPGR